ncbi:MAG: (2,3-dihydroxybenzoyl)adenylate synthase [Micromonosporaceae bacterium]|nr:(2,3-dihydroxybenzoyl)adenylate synthase [Micromonosporaceae bacterium]
MAGRDWVGWPVADADRYRSLKYWTGVTFGDLLRDWAARYDQRTALVDGARRWTYAQLDQAVDRLVTGLHQLGIRRGDRVIVQLPNRAEFVEVWFALQRLGAVPVHAMPGHRRAEITHLAQVSGAVAYVIADRHAGFDFRTLAAQVREARQDADEPLRHVIVIGDPGQSGFVSYADLSTVAPGQPLPPDGPAPSDLALLLLSGGTTGLPKLIPRSHDDYAYNARASAELCGLGSDTVYLAVLPIAFNFTLACPGVLGTLTSGGTVVVTASPDPQTAFSLIEREGVTCTALTPPLVPYWLEGYQESRPDLSSLRFVQVGGARLDDDLARRLEATLGTRLQQVYGMAEGLLNYTRLDDPDELVHTTQGRPLCPDDEVRVVDPADDQPVAPGESGELLTRGPYTLRGYYRATADATSFTPDGFYRTGDLVRQLPSGHLVVTGRIKDQINRGGEKIAATEVEELLLTHPSVRLAALIAAPDDEWGEVPVAVLVCDGSPPTARDVADFLRTRGLAAFKLPHRVECLDALPLTPLGKIDKKRLTAMFAQPQSTPPSTVPPT